MAAAVADYAPVSRAEQKVTKDADTITVMLRKNPDILSELGSRRLRSGGGPVLVGFAAETSDLTENAQAKLNQKGLDLIVLNDVSRADIAMSADHNEVTIIDRDGIVASIPRATKDVVAAEILRVVRPRLS